MILKSYNLYQTVALSGKVCTTIMIKLLSVYIISLGGDVPRDSPIPIVRESNLVEFIIAGVVSSIGILSTVFFFVFNLYYRKHP